MGRRASLKRKLSQLITTTVQQDDTCCVCLDPIQLPIKAPCNHTFCFLCLKTVIQTHWDPDSAPCPLCRGPIPTAIVDTAKLNLDAAMSKRPRTGNDPSTTGMSVDAENKQHEDAEDAVWEYSGRNGGWWMYEDRSNVLIEEGWQKGIEWERSSRIELARKVLDQARKEVKVSISVGSDGNIVTTLRIQRESKKDESKSDDEDSEEMDDCDEEEDDEEDDDEDDDQNFNSLSSITRLSHANPHRNVSLTIGASTYIADLFRMEQFESTNPHRKRRIQRSLRDNLKHEVNGSSAKLKGQAGVCFKA